MPAIHLAQAVGGDLMKGFIAAVAFATILAVVSGLTLSGASAVSHDLYASVFRHGNVDEATEVRVSRITTVVLGIVAIILGIIFEKINVAFMVGLAFAVAASANFPVLLLSIMWKGLTTRGAVIGGFVGLDQRAGAEYRQSRRVGGGVRLPEGLGLVPLRVAGPVHHPVVVFLLLAVLGDRQLEGRDDGAGGVRSPICPLADRHRRGCRHRPLEPVGFGGKSASRGADRRSNPEIGAPSAPLDCFAPLATTAFACNREDKGPGNARPCSATLP